MLEASNEQYDSRRTGQLNSQGIQVIRIPNNEIMNNFTGVYKYIDNTINVALSSKAND